MLRTVICGLMLLGYLAMVTHECASDHEEAAEPCVLCMVADQSEDGLVGPIAKWTVLPTAADLRAATDTPVPVIAPAATSRGPPLPA